jgi:hypothetical protein
MRIEGSGNLIKNIPEFNVNSNAKITTEVFTDPSGRFKMQIKKEKIISAQEIIECLK